MTINDPTDQTKPRVLTDRFGNIIDSGNGLYVQTQATKNSEYLFEICKGNIPGHTPIFFSGTNKAVSSTPETIRSVGGLYPFQTAASQWTIQSDSINDTSGGTGAQLLIIQGLDSNYDEISEIIVPNGTSLVNTVNSYIAVNGFSCIQAGSNNTNDGNIDLVANSTDNMARIVAGQNQALQAVKTVPNGKTWFTRSFTPTCGKDDELKLDAVARLPNGLRQFVSETYLFQSNFMFYNSEPIAFPATFGLEVRASKTGGIADSKISIVNTFLEIANDQF